MDGFHNETVPKIVTEERKALQVIPHVSEEE
jgi:hypothetical protein